MSRSSTDTRSEDPQRTREDRLLRICAVQRVGAEGVRDARGLLEHELDWDWLIEVAARHHIASLVGRSLEQIDEQGRVPARVRVELERLYHENAEKVSGLIDQLGSALGLLSDAGIDTVVLKGAALVHTVYADAGVRQMSDVDILLPREELERGRELLSEAMSLRYVDTQWHISDRGSVWNEIPIESIWSSAQSLEIADQPTQIMSPEHQLLHLCVHGDYFLRLRWLCDVAEVLNAYDGAMRWDEFVRLACIGSVADLAYFKLLSARMILDAQVPERVLERLHPGAFRANLTRRLIGRFSFTRSDRAGFSLNRSPEVYLLEFLTIARFPQRLNELKMLVAPEVEWMRTKYGARGPLSLALAYLIHPVHVLLTTGRVFIRHLLKRR